MSGEKFQAIDSLYSIAEHIEPSVVTYTRMASVSARFYAVFTSDKLWKYLNPYRVDSDIFKQFQRVCGQTIMEFRFIKMYWQQTDSSRIYTLPSNNLYIWLAFSLQNSVRALWGMYQQKHAQNPKCPLHDSNVRAQLYWCAINIKGPVKLYRDRMELVVKFIERQDFHDLSMLQGNDRNQLMVILSMCGSVLRHPLAKKQILENVSPDLYRDRQFMIGAAKASAITLEVVDSELWKDEQFIQSILDLNDATVRSYVPAHAQGALMPEQALVALTASRVPGTPAEGACALLEANAISQSQFIELVVANEENARGWRPSLSGDTAFISSVLEANGFVLKSLLPRKLRAEFKLVSTAVKSRGLALQYADPKFFACKDIVTKAVFNDGRALFYASKLLQDDASVVSAAVANHPTAILAASDRLQNDRDIIKLGFRNNGAEFFAMINPNLDARDDEELVLLAIERDHEAYLYASRRLANDPNFIFKALKANGSVFLVIPASLQAKEEIQQAVGPVNFRPSRKYVASGNLLPTSWIVRNSA